MKGIEFIHNDKTLTIGTEDGLLTLHIDSVDVKDRKGAFIYAAIVEYDTKTRNIWHQYTPVTVGDSIEIRMIDTQKMDSPVKSVYDNKITRPVSKLESFYRLESLLKEKGLI